MPYWIRTEKPQNTPHEGSCREGIKLAIISDTDEYGKLSDRQGAVIKFALA